MEQTPSVPTHREPLLGFKLRDYVFAAVTVATIHVIGFMTIALVTHIPIPGIRSVVSAPLSALVLIIGLACIGKPLALGLIMVLSSFVYLLISPVIPAFVLTSMIVAEAFNLTFFRGYRSPMARRSTVILFYTAMTPIATLFGAFLLGGEYKRFIASPLVLIISTTVVFLLCFATTWLGEKVVVELKRAGRID